VIRHHLFYRRYILFVILFNLHKRFYTTLISRIHFGKNNIKDQLRVKEVIMNVNKDEWQLTEIAAMWILMLTRKGGKE